MNQNLDHQLQNAPEPNGPTHEFTVGKGVQPKQPPPITPQVQITPEEYQVLLRKDLLTFAERSFQELNPSGLYVPNWHLELLADRLERCRRGELRRLIINVPPRSMKSIMASVALPAFWLGHNPSAQILCASYGQDLAEKHAHDCRKIMSSRWYQRVFPTRLSRQRNAVQEFTTTQNGTRFATSVGGVITGRGADVIIVDDPLKPEEAVSEAQRTRVNEWFGSTLYSRLNQKSTGVMIVIMQRLHTDDLVGHILEKEAWELVSLPAIAVEAEEFTYQTLRGEETHRRSPGDVLQPQRESRAILDGTRQQLGTYAFEGQYQQQPSPLGGGLVKAEWLRTYQPNDLPKYYDSLVMSWDTACKASDLADFSVCTVWGYKRPNIYLLEVYRKRIDYPTLKKVTRELKAKWNPHKILIEDKASGTQLIQELKQEQVYSATGVKPEGDKVMRMNAQTGFFEAGLVHLPEEALWLEDYTKELLAFPKSKFDDQVDSTAQALHWFHENGQEPAFITFMKNQIREMYGEEHLREMEERQAQEHERREARRRD